ncbi:unnamed protein product [Polarella glacialis]|uniref:Uncharacterized protein n=1 Tax=Polarella glacialis TaxID=89957 RepID=A0A813KR05_POLGL|nr:unnamed protein product [Polarella glacialis]
MGQERTLSNNCCETAGMAFIDGRSSNSSSNNIKDCYHLEINNTNNDTALPQQRWNNIGGRGHNSMSNLPRSSCQSRILKCLSHHLSLYLRVRHPCPSRATRLYDPHGFQPD